MYCTRGDITYIADTKDESQWKDLISKFRTEVHNIHNERTEWIETVKPSNLVIYKAYYNISGSYKHQTIPNNEVHFENETEVDGLTVSTRGEVVSFFVKESTTIDLAKYNCSDGVILNTSKPVTILNHENVDITLLNYDIVDEKFIQSVSDVVFYKSYFGSTSNTESKIKVKYPSNEINDCDIDYIEGILTVSDLECIRQHKQLIVSINLNDNNKECLKLDLPRLKSIQFDTNILDYVKEQKIKHLHKVNISVFTHKIKLSDLPSADNYCLSIFRDTAEILVDVELKGLDISIANVFRGYASNIKDIVKFEHFPTEEFSVDGSVFVFKDKTMKVKSARFTNRSI